MASIDELIKHSVNPFDNFASGNFWNEKQEQALTVESIHRQALTEIRSILKQVAEERITRTLIVAGDSGVGKTHFLGRLKKTLNHQAFFAYIEPFPESQYIWQHTLRYTVESLVNSPDGKKDSQLLLWLKSCLSSITNRLEDEERNFIENIKNSGVKANNYSLSERQQFINILKKSLGTVGIYNANEFYGILYELTNPSLNSLACEWLKGDHLDEDSLKQLGVGRCIDSENSARKLLANFSKISAKTQPIVLCFDQLDNIARLPDNTIDLPALFSANSTIHNEKWQGILVIISIITSTWKQNKKRIPHADLARTQLPEITLKNISLEQAKALWKTRLYPLHSQAKPKPNSDIYPLDEQVLLEEYPGGKALARDVLILGQQLIQEYKGGGTFDRLASFKLVWLHEFKKTQQKVTRIRHHSSVELVRMLQEVLLALQVTEIKQKLLPSPTYSHYSFSYKVADKHEKIGVAWTEEPSMRTFCYVMKACHKVIQRELCDTLYLIRSEAVGNSDTIGSKIYQEIFTDFPHHRIETDLNSVHYLTTYHNLVNAARAGELVVGSAVISLPELEVLIRESEIFPDCLLLQELGIFPKNNHLGNVAVEEAKKLKKVKDFLFNLVKINQVLGRNILTKQVKEEYAFVKETQLEELLEQLCQENQIQIVMPNDKPEKQSVCWIAKN